MTKTEDKLASIDAKLLLPPQLWKGDISDHMLDQRFLLDAVRTLIESLKFYASATEDTILYWDPISEMWFSDSGNQARTAIAHVEDRASEL